MELIERDLSAGCQKSFQHHEIEDLVRSRPASGSACDILFVTGNKHKVQELDDQFKSKHIRLSIKNLDLPEIQDSDALKIVQEKCKQAFKLVRSELDCRQDNQNATVLIEDTSLSFRALNGMPGPYVKWFMKAIGSEGLYKMLHGFEDKSAEAVCTYGLMNDESKIVFCRGTVRGRIVAPRGKSWGWDPIFEEERTGMTFAEMDQSMKGKFSHRSNAILVLKKYLIPTE